MKNRQKIRKRQQKSTWSIAFWLLVNRVSTWSKRLPNTDQRGSKRWWCHHWCHRVRCPDPGRTGPGSHVRRVRDCGRVWFGSTAIGSPDPNKNTRISWSFKRSNGVVSLWYKSLLFCFFHFVSTSLSLSSSSLSLWLPVFNWILGNPESVEDPSGLSPSSATRPPQSVADDLK